VLLTGAAGGIGSAVAKRLARAGATLLLTDLKLEPLERLAVELRAAGAEVSVLAADVTVDAGRDALIATASRLGVDVLINVAGVNPFGLLAEQDGGEIAMAMTINAVAPMLLCRAMLPVLSSRDSAHIVNVGSTFGSIGFPGFCAYSASKFAVRGFSEALRRELADTGIRVHYVAPRATRTALATDRIRAMNEALDVGMDSPEQVAAAIETVLRRERRSLMLGGPERVFALLNSVLPSLVDRSLRKQLPLIRRYATRSRAPRQPLPPSHSIHKESIP
jgi:short-subunit dehydrogenase